MKKISGYLSIRNKILLLPFLAISALFILFFISKFFMERNIFLLSQIENHFVPALELERDMEYLLTEMQRTMQDSVAAADEEKLYETEAIYDALLSLCEKGDENSFFKQEYKQKFHSELTDYFKLARETSLLLIKGKQLDEVLINNLNMMQEQYNTLKMKLQSETKRAKHEVSNSFSTALNNNKRSEMIMNIVIASCIILLGLISLFLIKSIIRPLQKLVEATNRIAEGDLTREINIRTSDELSMLGNAMEHMRRELGDFYQRLEYLVEKRTCQLRQSQKLEALGKMAGGTAHEFNNILAIILGALELIIKDLPGGTKQKQQLKQAYKTGERGRELVKEILVFSRSSQKETVSLKLDHVIQNAVKIIEPTLPSNIILSSHIQPSTFHISGNTLQIEQIIINLCNNAVQAMIKDRGIIDVHLDEVKADSIDSVFPGLSDRYYARIIIRDNGSGIPPDIQNHIFDPFFTTKEVGKGTGLGLSVVLGIVQQYGGKIRVKSKLGKGSDFEIVFPGTNTRANTFNGHLKNFKKPENRDNKAGNFKKKQILIVDNDVLSMKLPVMGLEKMGYDVILIGETSKAFAIFIDAPHKFDLVIVKLSMPEIDGIELGRKIRDIRKDIQILLCMEPHEILENKTAKALGITKLIHKPVTIRKLTQIVREIFGTSQIGI